MTHPPAMRGEKLDRVLVGDCVELMAGLPEASVERVTHILAGGHACSYEVRLPPGDSGEPAPVGDPAGAA